MSRVFSYRIFKYAAVCVMAVWMLCLPERLFARDDSISPFDSLIWYQQKLTTNLSDSLRLAYLYKVATGLAQKDPVKALGYAKQGIELADSVKNYLKKAKMLISTGVIYQMMADYKEAVQYYFKAIKIGEAEKNARVQSAGLNNIGLCYTSLGQYDLAEKYVKESLKVMMQGELFTELGISYNNLADISKMKGNIEQSIEYSRKAIEADEKYHTVRSTPFLNIGEGYMKLNQLQKAKYYYEHALSIELKEEYPDAYSLAACYLALGNFYTRTGDFVSAHTHLFNSEKTALNAGLISSMKDIYEAITAMYEKQGDYKNAFLYKDKFHAAKDSALSETNTRHINEMQAKYDLENKNKEIMLLNQKSEIAESKAREQNMLSRFLIAAFVLILLISFVLWRNVTLKQRVNSILQEKNKEIESQKVQIEETNQQLSAFNIELQKENIYARYETLKSKTDPHFLFNSLNTLSNLILRDSKKALEFVSKFSRFYRNTLELNANPMITLKEELSWLNNYLYLEQMRFGDNLRIKEQIDEKDKLAKIPPFAVQLLIENAIKHNKISEDEPLYISIETNGKYLYVKNNLQKRLKREETTGIGQNNIRERYRLLNLELPSFTETEEWYIARIPLITESQTLQIN